MLRTTITNREQSDKINPLLTTGSRVSDTSSNEFSKILRQKRSPKYVDLMKNLDVCTHAIDNSSIEELIMAIEEELPEVTVDQRPLGIVGKCYLEPPHEVHCLERDSRVVKHYKSRESLPPLLERARSLAMHEGYAFIEVYYDCLRAIKMDGTVSVVKGE